jgi:hypothetical protein
MAILGGDVVERLDKPSSYVEARARSRVLSVKAMLIPRPTRSFKTFLSWRRRRHFMLEIFHSTPLKSKSTNCFQSTYAHNEAYCRCGEIKKITMGLDRFQKTPCGFCFVEYQTHQQACDCMRFINGTKLDERQVRTDLDPGFKEGRQYGRGRSGGQVWHRELLTLGSG